MLDSLESFDKLVGYGHKTDIVAILFDAVFPPALRLFLSLVVPKFLLDRAALFSVSFGSAFYIKRRIDPLFLFRCRLFLFISRIL